MFKTLAEVKAAKPNLWPESESNFYLPSGWDGIVLDAFNCLESSRTLHKDSEYSALDSVRLAQVKEKFGTLRIYFNYDTDEDVPKHITANVNGVFRLTEHLSCFTCQSCGVRDDTVTRKTRNGSWLVTECDTCFTKSVK